MQENGAAGIWLWCNNNDIGADNFMRSFLIYVYWICNEILSISFGAGGNIERNKSWDIEFRLGTDVWSHIEWIYIQPGCSSSNHPRRWCYTVSVYSIYIGHQNFKWILISLWFSHRSLWTSAKPIVANTRFTAPHSGSHWAMQISCYSILHVQFVVRTLLFSLTIAIPRAN